MDMKILGHHNPFNQSHICILYSPGPVPAGLSHRMGIWSNPLKNGLIQRTSKITIVF